MPIFATTILSVKANYSQFFTFLSFQKQVVSESTDAAVFDAAESIGWKGTPRDVLGKP
jgi:hypothetical protein